MAEDIKIEVVTPEKSVVSEIAKIVMASGSLGEFGVLSGHTPFLTALKTGSIRFTDASGQEKFVFVSGGFAEALPDKVTVLAESAERRKDIDIERAKSALERAKKRLSLEKEHGFKDSTGEDFDFDRARAALLRAVHRMRVMGTV